MIADLKETFGNSPHQKYKFYFFLLYCASHLVSQLSKSYELIISWTYHDNQNSL